MLKNNLDNAELVDETDIIEEFKAQRLRSCVK